MPITPLHVGPGLVLKTLGGERVSLTIFVLAQVTMDIEVVARAAAGAERWHGLTNSVMGATVVLLLTVAYGTPVCEWALRWWNRNLSPAQEKWLALPTNISWPSAWTGGVLGVYSHLILDAIMHADARPWAPFSEANPLAGSLSIAQLDLLCLGSLPVSAVIFGLIRAINCRRSAESGDRLCATISDARGDTPSGSFRQTQKRDPWGHFSCAQVCARHIRRPNRSLPVSTRPDWQIH